MGHERGLRRTTSEARSLAMNVETQQTPPIRSVLTYIRRMCVLRAVMIRIDSRHTASVRTGKIRKSAARSDGTTSPGTAMQ
ncbi:MAG TPA: hypothetical protein DEW39_04225 [Brevibacterium sp.]|nr:hypothetical protein [Brevibacterium sp.]